MVSRNTYAGSSFRITIGIAVIVVLLAGGAGAVHVSELDKANSANAGLFGIDNSTETTTGFFDLAWKQPVSTKEKGDILAGTEEYRDFDNELGKNKIIIQFYDEPVFDYAVTLKNELVRKREEINKLERTVSIDAGNRSLQNQLIGAKVALRNEEIQANTKIKAYRDNIFSTHSNARNEIGQEVKIIKEYTEVFNGIAVETSKEKIEKLKNTPNIKAVYPDKKVYTLLSDSAPLINATEVWQIQDASGKNVTGKNVKVAIIDTGIDYMHPDLGGGFGPEYKVIAGWDVFNNDPDPMDDHGHGTHVAGIVAANGSLRGIAPDAQLMAYKVLSSGGWGSWSDIIAGIERAVDPDGDPLTSDGADIISMSLGGWGNPDDPVSQAVDKADDAGVLVVVAAGNSGPSKNTIGSPGTARKALTVGATDISDAIASFSSRGPVTWANGSIIKPEVVAPGVSINSTVPNESTPLGSNTGYRELSGTSMATPHVSGAAALLLQLHPEWTSKQLKSALITTSVDLNYDVYTQGAGRIDVFKAASAEALVTPGILSLGMVNTSRELWKVYSSIELKNIAGAVKDFNISVQMPYSAGITTELSPANISLNPDSSAVLNFSLVVNNSVVSGGNYEGDILIRSGTMVLRIPFGFIRPPAALNDVYGDYGIDTDGNQLYDFLAIDIGVNVSKSGNYYVTVDLRSLDGYYLVQNSTYRYLPEGNQNITVLLNGIDIRRNKISGPYVLDNVWLVDDNSLVDYRDDTYITHQYNYTEFQRSPAEFKSGINDYGIDENGNGLYDYLVIEKQVNVTTAGTYELDGYLYNSSGYYIGSAYNYTTLNSGEQNVTLRFDGVQIYRSNSTGNFTVSTSLYGYSSSGLSAYLESENMVENASVYPRIAKTEESNIPVTSIKPLAVSQKQLASNSPVYVWQWLDSGTDITNYYSYTWFERPVALFNDVYSDYGLDTDGNGLYDYLAIDIGVNVSRTGYYYVSGSLYNDSGWYIDSVSNYTNLNAGNQMVQLRFNRARIWQYRTNGTFNLRYLSVNNATNWNQLDYRDYAYTTSSYNYTDFRPQAELMPGISDHGIDENINGLYDYLIIEKQVNVTTAGTYELDGYLYNSSGYYIGSVYNYTTLSAGVQNITLRFDGVRIYRSNSTGNFTVSTNLFGYSSSGLAILEPEKLIKKISVEPNMAEIEELNISVTDIKPLAISQHQLAGDSLVYVWQWFDSGTDMTGYYNYIQFERPQVKFNDTYLDFGLDTDSNGFYDYIIIDVGLNVSKAGYYQVSGSLYNGSGWYIGSFSNYTNLNTGNQTVQLRFNGANIWQYRMNGTFDLRYLSVYNTTNWDQLDYRYHAYTTNSYNYTDFRPQAVLVPGISDYGIDENGNGLYDYLVVEKQINVTIAGTYELDGNLYDPSGYYIGSVYNYTTLNAGIQNITLRFEGERIYRSNNSGNFTVSTSLFGYSSSDLSASTGSEKSIEQAPVEPTIAETEELHAPVTGIKPLANLQQQPGGVSTWRWFDSSTDSTGYYSYIQFERPPALFNGIYSDYGLDTNKNRLYDYLVIDVGVNVSKAGYYRISSELYSNSGVYVDWSSNDITLNPGNQTVQLRFNGARIWQYRLDGTFDVKYLSVYNASNWNQLDYRYYAYTTKSYNSTDFEHPVPDAYEPDDTYSEARYLSTDGVKQTHDFHIAGDQDWVRFNASAGESYIIETSDLGTESDTYVYLYYPNLTEITSNDDSGDELSSRIDWTNDIPDTYYIMIRHFSNSAFGHRTRYNISVNSVNQTPLPDQSSAYAVRDIMYQSLSPGSSTNVTVRVTSNISQALSLKETIPEGWGLVRISDDADSFKNGTNEWVWFNVSTEAAKTVIYRINMPSNASIGTNYINGSISNSSGVIAIVRGENTISSDIVSYYRSFGNDPDVVDTTDLLKAADDWSNDKAAPGFSAPITTVQLLVLADEWSRG